MKKHQVHGIDRERRRARRLELHRETLRRLDAGALAGVAGGIVPLMVSDETGYTTCGPLTQ